MTPPLYIRIEDMHTGQAWIANGWGAVVVLASFALLVCLLVWVIVRTVLELLG